MRPPAPARLYQVFPKTRAAPPQLLKPIPQGIALELLVDIEIEEPMLLPFQINELAFEMFDLRPDLRLADREMGPVLTCASVRIRPS